MSEQVNKMVSAAGQYAFKGMIAALVVMAGFIFNEIRDAVTETSKVVNEMSKVVERLDANVTRNIDDIKELRTDVRHLDETKQNKH